MIRILEVKYNFLFLLDGKEAAFKKLLWAFSASLKCFFWADRGLGGSNTSLCKQFFFLIWMNGIPKKKEEIKYVIVDNSL